MRNSLFLAARTVAHLDLMLRRPNPPDQHLQEILPDWSSADSSVRAPWHESSTVSGTTKKICKPSQAIPLSHCDTEEQNLAARTPLVTRLRRAYMEGYRISWRSYARPHFCVTVAMQRYHHTIQR